MFFRVFLVEGLTSFHFVQIVSFTSLFYLFCLIENCFTAMLLSLQIQRQTGAVVITRSESI